MSQNDIPPMSRREQRRMFLTLLVVGISAGALGAGFAFYHNQLAREEEARQLNKSRIKTP
jgi:hypothetical protein